MLQRSNFMFQTFLISQFTQINFKFIFLDNERRFFLPLNARNVVIKKLAPSLSRIQLKESKTENNFLKHYSPGEIEIGDDIAVMEQPESEVEEIFIPGPLKTKLLLQAGYKVGHPVNISYQFAEMKSSAVNEIKTSSEKASSGPFMWDFLLPDGKCSERCDGGMQEISAVSKTRNYVDF